MTAVRTTTTEFPELQGLLDDRHRSGQDTYDEWWQGEYKTVTGPTPEHGELVAALNEIFGPLVRERGLRQSAPVNIGIDKADCRVPDLGVYEPDTPRTSPAFLSTARLVVEVLSPGEVRGAKLRFYEAVGVEEYLEIDLNRGSLRLLGMSDVGWTALTGSHVLGFDVGQSELVVGEVVLDVTQFAIQGK